MADLSGWSNFYVIVGSSAGALIGLQFVVIALISDMNPGQVDALASGAFATPSVVHFGVVLLLSAIVSMPWQSRELVALMIGLVGTGGAIYSVVVLRLIRRQSVYHPVLEDWLFHLVLPFGAYVGLIVAAALALSQHAASLYLVAAGALVLLFIGIHNAWDTATYNLVNRRPAAKGKSARK